MKTRQDFVTNSSSSSYIIAYQQLPDYIDKGTLERYPAIKCFNKLVEKVLFASSDYNETRAGTKVSTKADLDAYFIDQYGWGNYNTLEKIFDEEDYLKSQYEKCAEALERGSVLLFKRIDYSDDTISSLIKELSNGSVGIKIISCN